MGFTFNPAAGEAISRYPFNPALASYAGPGQFFVETASGSSSKGFNPKSTQSTANSAGSASPKISNISLAKRAKKSYNNLCKIEVGVLNCKDI